MPNKQVRLTDEEHRLIREMRVVKAGNDGKEVRASVYVGDAEFQNFIDYLVVQAREQKDAEYEGYIVSWIIKLADEPSIRNNQRTLWQMLGAHYFGLTGAEGIEQAT